MVGLSSAVDYAIVSQNLFDSVVYFAVGDWTSFTDHCMISLRLNLPVSIETEGEGNSDKPVTLYPGPVKYSWDENSANNFSRCLQEPGINSQLENLKRWFDKDCLYYRRKVRQTAKTLQKNQFDRNCRDKYYTDLKSYKSFLRKKKRSYVNIIVIKIVNKNGSNPKLF
jgi:hypothetical protein